MRNTISADANAKAKYVKSSIGNCHVVRFKSRRQLVDVQAHKLTTPVGGKRRVKEREKEISM